MSKVVARRQRGVPAASTQAAVPAAAKSAPKKKAAPTAVPPAGTLSVRRGHSASSATLLQGTAAAPQSQPAEAVDPVQAAPEEAAEAASSEATSSGTRSRGRARGGSNRARGTRGNGRGARGGLRGGTNLGAAATSWFDTCKTEGCTTHPLSVGRKRTASEMSDDDNSGKPDDVRSPADQRILQDLRASRARQATAPASSGNAAPSVHRLSPTAMDLAASRNSDELQRHESPVLPAIPNFSPLPLSSASNIFSPNSNFTYPLGDPFSLDFGNAQMPQVPAMMFPIPPAPAFVAPGLAVGVTIPTCHLFCFDVPTSQYIRVAKQILGAKLFATDLFAISQDITFLSKESLIAARKGHRNYSMTPELVTIVEMSRTSTRSRLVGKIKSLAMSGYMLSDIDGPALAVKIAELVDGHAYMWPNVRPSAICPPRPIGTKGKYIATVYHPQAGVGTALNHPVILQVLKLIAFERASNGGKNFYKLLPAAFGDHIPVALYASTCTMIRHAFDCILNGPQDFGETYAATYAKTKAKIEACITAKPAKLDKVRDSHWAHICAEYDLYGAEGGDRSGELFSSEDEA